MAVAPTARGVTWDAPAPADYPVRYDVPAAGRQRRWRVALRLLLVLPHLVALYLCFYLAELITLAAWLIGVFSGRYEPGLAALPIACLRWEARVLTYAGLLRDEYPSFLGGAYPMQFELTLQTRQSRASIFFRAPLVLPQVVVLYVLSTVWIASVALAWFALLITGRYPEGLRRLVIGLNRWLLRVVAYLLLLRGDYPPFSLGISAPAETSPYLAAAPALAPSGPPLTQTVAVAPQEQPPTVYAPYAPPAVVDERSLGPVPEPVSTPSFWPRDAITPSASGKPGENDPAATRDQPRDGQDDPPAHGPTFFRPRREPPQS